MTVILKTATDFEDSIAFLIDGMTEEMQTGIYYQTRDLNSDNFNKTFDLIESRLNRLYEKSRVMEDVIRYTREFVEQNIYDTTKECRSILASLEENRDKLKTNSFITYGVSLLEGSGSYTDRDGSALPHCGVNDDTLTLSGSSGTVIPIKSITRKKSPVPYKSTLDNVKEGNPYRAFYLVDGQIVGGLQEELYIELSSPAVVNFMELILSKCTVDNVRYIDEQGGIEYEDNFKSIITRDRTVKAIQFTLKSTLYRTSTYYIDKKNVKENFWDSVKEFEYNTNMGIQNVVDLDELAGINAFKKAYDAYLVAMKAYNDRRESIAKTNRANGYTDSGAYVDAMSIPDEIKDGLKANRSPFNADPFPTVEQIIRYGGAV